MSPTCTAPGLEIYSDAWMDEVATNVPEILRPVVQSVCRNFQLGNSGDPNTIARIIETELAAQLGDSSRGHVIEKVSSHEGEHESYALVYPDSVHFDVRRGWSWGTDEWPFFYRATDVVGDGVTAGHLLGDEP